jgi:hypothetical protein
MALVVATLAGFSLFASEWLVAFGLVIEIDDRKEYK